MNGSVVSALLPVVFLIATGFVAARLGFIRAEATKDLSNLVFMVLTPALLFRTMSGVQVQDLNFRPVAVYFVAAGLLYLTVLLLGRVSRRSAVLGLAGAFSNTVMIGIPLIDLAYGQQGMVTLLTLISVHSLILLTAATVALELVSVREQRLAGRSPQRHVAWTVALAVRNGIVHPVPLPIILGLLFAQTGLVLPQVVDRPLHWLGSAFGPVALLLVGAMLSQVRIGQHVLGALGLSSLKNMALPLLMAVLGWGWGLHGLPLTVMVVTAALPMGANVFLFAQRYDVAQELITASLAVSTVLGLLTVTAVMAWADRLA